MSPYCQTLLKILQHARESGGQGSGQLLGFDNHKVLEVTEAFPYPSGEQLDEDEQEEYVDDMIKVLRDVNADNNTVGWYQSCQFDGFISYGLLEDQIMCQNRLHNSILLAVDLARSANGPPALHALRLREGFQTLYRERKAGAAGTLPTVAALAEEGLFEELPIAVRISALERILLLQQHRDGLLPVVGTPSIVELEQLLLKDAATDLSRAVDEVLGEAGRMQHYLRTTSKQQQALNAQLMRLVPHTWDLDYYHYLLIGGRMCRNMKMLSGRRAAKRRCPSPPSRPTFGPPPSPRAFPVWWPRPISILC